MIELKINGLKKVVCPSRWDEVSAGQLIELERTDKKDILKLFEILTGVPVSLAGSSRDPHLEAHIFTCVRFLYEPFDWVAVTHSPYLDYKGKLYKVPGNFSKMMTGQKILIHQIAAQENLVDNIAKTVAICMQPIIDGEDKYNEKRVAEIEIELLKENGLRIYSLARFFFRNLLSLSNIGIRNLAKSQSQKIPMRILLTDCLRVTD